MKDSPRKISQFNSKGYSNYNNQKGNKRERFNSDPQEFKQQNEDMILNKNIVIDKSLVKYSLICNYFYYI